MSKVSVILTSYNHAKYLRESIESVLNQTYTDFELIIGDDASTDESWDIIQSYTDPRIHAYRHETNRMGGVVNETVLSGRISGEYIAIHHSDDVWEPQKLEEQVAFLDIYPEIGAVFSNVRIVKEDGELLEDVSHYYHKIFDQPNRTRFEWLNYFFYNGNALCHPSVLIRKTCYDNCGLYRYGFAQVGDFDMWVRLCLKYEIYVLPERLVRFRVREGESNTSGSRPEVYIRSRFEFLQIYSNYLSITDRDEFLQVFPDSSRYLGNKEFDIPFALAMAALSSPYAFGKLFGLQLLFGMINDPEYAKKIAKLYGFRNFDLFELTAKHDIFSVIEIPELKRKISELEQQLAEQNRQIAEQNRQTQALTAQLHEITTSRSWRFAMCLMRIRVFIIPPGSWRTDMARKLFSLLIFPYTIIRRVYNNRKSA